MQNTRLSTLVDRAINQFGSWLRNPWRRLSMLIISLLFGNFMATTLSTVAGQQADLDVVISLMLVLFAEFTSWLVYRGESARAARRATTTNATPLLRPLWLEMLNGYKLGLTYGLFVEAFKLGS